MPAERLKEPSVNQDSVLSPHLDEEPNGLRTATIVIFSPALDQLGSLCRLLPTSSLAEGCS
ncbi:hypothetical protein M404DRAFT_1005463 [Pisolithus tinctorius Marx 270]|uniref:Uncharacterized protein n=1 Tax=Pisolithus tinctorius Marx 270 TaxID=870435 RepID=A0A0C3NSX5_PISTI|nr:hypothetical protein M404DRAFT_1005463 [Pisolithus tinctorius Marx 270]